MSVFCFVMSEFCLAIYLLVKDKMPPSEVAETAFQHIRLNGRLQVFRKQLFRKDVSDLPPPAETPEGMRKCLLCSAVYKIQN